jgi:hypothetical protein
MFDASLAESVRAPITDPVYAWRTSGEGEVFGRLMAGPQRNSAEDASWREVRQPHTMPTSDVAVTIVRETNA